jgi:hypothetical protein
MVGEKRKRRGGRSIPANLFHHLYGIEEVNETNLAKRKIGMAGNGGGGGGGGGGGRRERA